MSRNVVITVNIVKMVSTVVKIVVKIVAMIVAKIGVSLLCQFLIFYIVSLVSGGFQLVLLVSGGYQMPVKELWAEDSESNYNTTGYWEDCQPLSDCLAFA